MQSSFIRDFCLLSADLKQTAFHDSQLHLFKIVSTSLLASHVFSLPAAANASPESKPVAGVIVYERFLAALTPEIALNTFLEKDGYAFLDLVDVRAQLLLFFFFCSTSHSSSSTFHFFFLLFFLSSRWPILHRPVLRKQKVRRRKQPRLWACWVAKKNLGRFPLCAKCCWYRLPSIWWRVTCSN